MRDELATMNALLRMQTEVEDGAMDHFVREWMKQLRELAYDAEDCIDLYIFRIKCGPKLGVYIWCKRQLERLLPRHCLAGEMRALRARAVAISERHARYGVSRDALMSRARPLALVPVLGSSAHALCPTNDPDQLVGIRAQAIDLANKVKAVTHKERDMKLKVFSIVGFGGLGKTTLAMEVCRQLEMDFDRQANVSVSQAFDGGKDLQVLLKHVLHQVAKAKSQNDKGINEEANDSLGEIDTMDVDQLAIRLKEFLDDKRYLIVVDDVWTISAWDAIQSKLPSSRHGSRIIVTTRIDSVAKECSDPTVGVYPIKQLNLKDSRKLFMSKAFGSMEASCPTDLEITMDKILKKCGGLPLAIISIGSLLASYRSPESKDMWDTICKSIGSQMDSSPTLEGMRQIITLSYNHLPYNLKGCMMYLSIFPEDYEIRTIRLLYRWIAEGLAKACRVHDMMLEVMVSKSFEANFVSLVGSQYETVSYDRIRRLSIHDDATMDSSSPKKQKKEKAAGHSKSNGIEMMSMKRVRSLTMFEIEGHHNLLSRMREFTLLRVLDLEGCKGLENKHVEHICGMYLLRFLSLRNTEVSVLPKKIGELEHLQMLNVDCTSIEKLPEEVTKLERLENVDFRNKHQWSIMWTPPQGLYRMKALREVNYMIVNDVHVAREVGKLGQLRHIGIWVSQENEEVLRELACSLSKTCSLRALAIGCFRQGPVNFLLQMESPPRLLRYLNIDGDIDELPNWSRSLAYFAEIDIMNTCLVKDQAFGVLCNLPNLQRIWLGPRAYVDHQLVARTSHNFPMLRNLGWCCRGTHPGLRFEKGSMDKLEELIVQFGADRTSIVGVEHLPNLKQVELMGDKHDSSLSDTLDQLMAESKTRPEHKQFKVVAKYQ
uniref:Uncharacterized protein n=1 Tax=Avena sativa TaxID=4498 RepID=A0ACD5Y2S9_AVESA